MIRDHFAEFLLTFILVGMMAFVVFMGHVHNDSLASKGTEFAAQVLASILTAAQIKRGGPPPNP